MIVMCTTECLNDHNTIRIDKSLIGVIQVWHVELIGSVYIVCFYKELLIFLQHIVVDNSKIQ